MKQKKLDAVKALDEKIKQQALKKAANGQPNVGNDKLIISGGPPSGSPSIFAKLGAGRGPRPGPNTPEAAKLKAARILQAQSELWKAMNCRPTSGIISEVKIWCWEACCRFLKIQELW